MLVIRNNILPFPGFKALAIWPFIFTRSILRPSTRNHEEIHGRQQLELLIIGFYLWYLIEWIIRSIQYRSFKDGYHNISFELEAYSNEHFLEYLKYRPFWEFLKFI